MFIIYFERSDQFFSVKILCVVFITHEILVINNDFEQWSNFISDIFLSSKQFEYLHEIHSID